MYRPALQAARRSKISSAFAARIADYGLDGTNFLFSHERVTFGIRDTAALRRRFMIYSNAMEVVLDRLAAAGRQAVAVQELGGFLSVHRLLLRREEARCPELVHRAVVLSRQTLLYARQPRCPRYDAGRRRTRYPPRCAPISTKPCGSNPL